MCKAKSNSLLSLALFLELLQKLFALVLDRNTYIPTSTLPTHSKYCTPSPQNLASLRRMPSRRYHRRTRNPNAPKHLQTQRYVLETKIRYCNGHTTRRKLCRTILQHLGTMLCQLLSYKPHPLLTIHRRWNGTLDPPSRPEHRPIQLRCPSSHHELLWFSGMGIHSTL
jgi:hypothetical protein